ncbi:MAG: bifunctional precorrin-2 dehydrogenase/sirohydrochlorin ferrochelatase [Thermoleophilia bacterium]|nr:bifunctional precorrin-2 dehydrogenase/sirohydrochlorin ferrochelatase [Thermoleophilia bacterium]
MLDVAGRRCIVVGGGEVGAERARTLKEHGARVTVVSPETSAPLGEMLLAGDIDEHHKRPFEAGDVVGCSMVVAATDDRGVNASVAAAAAREGVPCNVAGSGARGDVVLPAVLRRGPLTVAVSTGGTSPRLARLVRDRMGREYDEAWGELVQLIGELRADLEGVPADERDAVMGRMVDGPAPAMIAGGAGCDRVKLALRRELGR